VKRYWYICDVNPVPWRVGPVGATRNKSTGRMKGYVGRDAELHAYQEAIRESLRSQGTTLLDGPISVTMWFWRAIEEYKTEKAAKARSNEADGTNLYKGTEDACQGLLFNNDRNNISGHWYIVEQGPESCGRVVICVEQYGNLTREDPLSYIPDEIHAAIFGRDGDQLRLAVDAPKTTLEKENDRYATTEVDF